MKKFLLFTLCCATIFCCTKEPVVTDATEKSREETVASDRGPDCSTNQCSIKVEIPVDAFNVFHDFKVYKIVDGSLTLVWDKQIVSLECGNQNIMNNTWYPITIEQNYQYKIEYTYEWPCSHNTLAAGGAAISIKTATSTQVFYMATGTTPTTNPDREFFSRQSCTIIPG